MLPQEARRIKLRKTVLYMISWCVGIVTLVLTKDEKVTVLRWLGGDANSEWYLAYFQAYTSTYQEVEYLRNMYQQALSQANVIGLCVGTRPDCVPDEVLILLKEYIDQGYEVRLELGLQSASDKTLKKINRGHCFSAYQDAVERASVHGIKICSHLIIGLPNERLDEAMFTLGKVLSHPLDGLKLHPLHVVQGSTMAKAWRVNQAYA